MISMLFLYEFEVTERPLVIAVLKANENELTAWSAANLSFVILYRISHTK